MRSLGVIQHTSADYLGLMEDHLEGRRIRFRYFRPFTEGAVVPRFEDIGDCLVLLGGGPWGAAGTRNVPTLKEEIALTRTCLMMDVPILAFGLGAQILALAADGEVEAADLAFRVGYGHRTDPEALNGYLPERFPFVSYMRDRPVPPYYAKVLAEDADGRPALFQIGSKVLGFTFHPGFKLAIAEDLIMEFEESPADAGGHLARAGAMKREIEDALVPMMTGIVQLAELMRPKDG
jgi:GMP synthase-like glutamine amidotransferase